jgi:hypothetical protein
MAVRSLFLDINDPFFKTLIRLNVTKFGGLKQIKLTCLSPIDITQDFLVRYFRKENTVFSITNGAIILKPLAKHRFFALNNSQM